MSNEQNHLERLRRLDEEMTNVKELQDSYLQLLEKQFPKLTSEEINKASMVLRSLANKMENNRRAFKYSQKNQTAYTYFGLDESGYTRLKKDYKGKSERYAKAFLSMIKVRDSQWRTPIDIDRDFIKQTNDIHLACWFVYFDSYYGTLPKSKDTNNWFQSYLIEPKFSVGDIVSLRATLPEAAVKYEYDWGRGHVGFKMKHVDKSFKKRTFMILGEYQRDTGARYYEKTYKPNVNGGMRRYKVLPVGDTTVYYIIERCLKKNKTKAVKDAKGT